MSKLVPYAGSPEIKVQRGIPLAPEGSTRPKGFSKYPFYELTAKGMSFFVPGGSRNTLSSRACNIGAREDREFAVREVYRRKIDGDWVPCEADDKGATRGVGVWRVR